MAITYDYVDFATGNDYKGPTFTDGSFANATLTLTKAGAFAASKVNHWLYLDDNGSGRVTAGYYRITTVVDANSVVLHADIRSGVNDPTDVVCIQHDGTTSLPWRSVQGALDLLTRGAAGNQVNVKAGTAVVNAAVLDLTTFIAGGALSYVAPLVVRGYTVVADDGGQGRMDTPDDTRLLNGTITNVSFIDMHLYGGAYSGGWSSGWFTNQGNFCAFINCHIQYSHFAGRGLVLGTYPVVVGCYFSEASSLDVSPSTGGLVAYNYFGNETRRAVNVADGATAIGNIIVAKSSDQGGLYLLNNGVAIGNIIYSTDGIGTGIYGAVIYNNRSVCYNNIIVGFSGAGACGIRLLVNKPLMLGNNAFYNNTTDVSVAVDATMSPGADVSLLADPFVDAANGDFSLTPAAKAALADKGFPTQYLGAHANTDPHITIGAIQQALATGGGGGFPKIASVLGRTRM